MFGAGLSRGCEMGTGVGVAVGVGVGFAGGPGGTGSGTPVPTVRVTELVDRHDSLRVGQSMSPR